MRKHAAPYLTSDAIKLSGHAGKQMARMKLVDGTKQTNSGPQDFVSYSANQPTTKPRAGQEAKSVTKKRVAVVIGHLDVGGAEKDIVRNFPRLDKDKYEVIILTFGKEGALADEIRAKGIRVVSRTGNNRSYIAKRISSSLMEPSTISQSPSFFVWNLFRKCMSVAKKLVVTINIVLWLIRTTSKEQINIVHAFLPNSYFYSGMAYLLSFGRFYFVMSRLSLNYYFRDHRLLSFLEVRFLHKICNRFVGNSQAVLRNLESEGVSRNKLFLLYNGIDAQEFYRDPISDRVNGNEPIMISAVANLHNHKGYEDLLSAIKLLVGKGITNFKLRIAGRDQNGNLNRYTEYCRKQNLENNVEFLGEIDGVADLLGQSALHVHASHTEGLPNSIIEGMAAGLPIVATAVGGIPELVEHERNGLLVRPRRPQELADAIEKMILDRDKRIEYGKCSLRRAQRLFDISNSVSRYEELYESLLAEDRKSNRKQKTAHQPMYSNP